MVTTKQKIQKLVFNPATQKLIDFLDELEKLAKEAFGRAAHAIIRQFMYAKMSPHLKKSINQAHLENGTYEQIVSHLEKELELNALEDPNELQIKTVRQHVANINAERPELCKNQCRLLKKKQKRQAKGAQTIPGNKNSGANKIIPHNNDNFINKIKITELKER